MAVLTPKWSNITLGIINLIAVTLSHSADNYHHLQLFWYIYILVSHTLNLHIL